MATATTESEDLLILPQEDTDTLVMDKEATNDEIIAPTNNSISFDENEITLDDNSLEESTLEITEDKEVKKEENTSDSLEITEDKEVKKEENTSDSLEITEDIDL